MDVSPDNVVDFESIGVQGAMPAAIKDTEFIPDAYKHRDAFLRKLIEVSSTEDINAAVSNVLSVILEDEELSIDYATLLQWSNSRTELICLGTNIPAEYTQAMVQHINEIQVGIMQDNLSAYVNNKKGVLSYPSAQDRHICVEYHIPLYFGKKLIGALYIESRTDACEKLLDSQVFELLFVNFGLILNNILLLKRVLRHSNIDGLTKLYNRRYMDSYVESLALANESYVVIMFDIDNFKGINDTHGHAVGDMVLTAVAGTLSAAIRKEVDYAFRYGGEEFLIILKNISLAEAVTKAEAIRNIVSQLHVYYSPYDCIQLTISAGVAQGGTLAPKTVVSNADAALYKAKSEGRNCVRCFEDAR